MKIDRNIRNELINPYTLTECAVDIRTKKLEKIRSKQE